MIPCMQNPMIAFANQHYTTMSPYQQAYDQYMVQYNSNMNNLLAVMKFKNQIQNYMMNMSYPAQVPQIPKSYELSSYYDHKDILNSSYSQSLSPQSMASTEPISTPELPEGRPGSLEAQIKYLINFFVNNYGILTNKQIQAEKLKYSHDGRLLELFNLLISKYTSSNKTREEMVKWIIRKALRTGRQTIKGDKKMNQNQLSNDLCKRYFKEGAPEEEEEEAESDFLLPFRKNSKNKTMNANFITEIFTSGEFQEDFEIFLNEFEEVADKELQEKLHKFTVFVVECIREGKPEKISKYRRVPWLRVWIKNTKKVAFQLNEQHNKPNTNKKVKNEF